MRALLRPKPGTRLKQSATQHQFIHNKTPILPQGDRMSSANHSTRLFASRKTNSGAMSHASGITKRADKSWKTLLHEHHHSFLATQHPSASQTLTVLQAVSSTPARMWPRGIHTFIQVLAHACPNVAPRPRSHEHGESAISSLAIQILRTLWSQAFIAPEAVCAPSTMTPS